MNGEFKDGYKYLGAVLLISQKARTDHNHVAIMKIFYIE